jgi:hypothetical protein
MPNLFWSELKREFTKIIKPTKQICFISLNLNNTTIIIGSYFILPRNLLETTYLSLTIGYFFICVSFAAYRFHSLSHIRFLLINLLIDFKFYTTYI